MSLPGWNGDFDPARLSYVFVWICGTVFIVLTILDFIIHKAFNGIAFSTGCCAIAVQMVAAGAGVRVKQNSEIPFTPASDCKSAPPRKSMLRRVAKTAPDKDTA